MRQTDLRNIPPCYLRNSIDAVPSTIRDLLLTDEACEGEEKDGKIRFGACRVNVKSDATVEIYGANAELRDRILSKLQHFDIEKVG